MIKEEWKNIRHFEGLYQISNFGFVRSLNYNKTGKMQIMMLSQAPNGYYSVNLSKDGKIYHYYIHRLVAEAFVPNPNNYTEINHKDEDKSHNVWLNLEWVDHISNCTYGTRNSRISKNKSKHSVNQYSVDGTFIKHWSSVYQIKQELGIDRAAINRVCQGKQKTSLGYVWRYS